jgi:hypothetical protein
MDPITAVSFAASILTFIDFGYKVVTGTLEIFKTGTSSENARISVVINDLCAVVKPLSREPPGESDHEKALKALAVECQELSRELVSLLERLKMAPDRSKWKSVKVALHSMRKKGEVADLEDKLGKYRSQILLRLALILK